MYYDNHLPTFVYKSSKLFGFLLYNKCIVYSPYKWNKNAINFYSEIWFEHNAIIAVGRGGGGEGGGGQIDPSPKKNYSQKFQPY